MKKKGFWVLIFLVLGFIIYDYISTSREEQEALERAQEASQIVSEEEPVEEAETDVADENSEEDTESASDDEDTEASESVSEDEAVDLDLEDGDLTEEEIESLVEEYSGGSNENSGPMIQFGASPGDRAYDFYLEDLDGNAVSLSDFRGKKVFLNFWASWCPPCRVEMPHLQEFSEENEDVMILGVNVTTSESNLDNVEEFVDEFGITFPTLYGTEELFYLYYVESLPTSYFIDSKGIVNEAVVGPVTKDILEARFSMMD